MQSLHTAPTYAGVSSSPPHGAFEEAGTSVAADGPVVTSVGDVTAHGATQDFDGTSSTCTHTEREHDNQKKPFAPSYDCL